jgi:DNA-binding response OmpR family regulator
MRRRLLVVEGECDNASRLGTILDSTQYLVRSARSLLAAWTILGRGRPPDLVVLDLVLCDGSGLDLYREVKARWPTLPVLVVTTREGGAARNYVRRADAHVFLAKPFGPDALAAAVRAALMGVPRRPLAARSRRPQAASNVLCLVPRPSDRDDQP